MKCENCNAPVDFNQSGQVRFDSSQYHMDAVKKLSRISALKGAWLEAIEAIDWMEEETAEPCKPYPQLVRDEDRKWIAASVQPGLSPDE